MQTIMYGPNDNYDLNNSHVVLALIRKSHEAKSSGASYLQVWGSGRPRREFLYVDDMAEGCIFLMESGVNDGRYNIGVGSELTIRELAETIADVVGFSGDLVFDASKPDGTPQKLLDASRMKRLGWMAVTDMRSGLELSYQDFQKTYNEAKLSGLSGRPEI